MKKTITYPDVENAIVFLQANQMNVNASTIRTQLGRGGLDTIQRHLHTWRTHHVPAIEALPALPPRIAKTMGDLWSLALTDAAEKYSIERAALLAQTQAAQQEMEQKQVLLQQTQQLMDELKQQHLLLENKQQKLKNSLEDSQQEVRQLYKQLQESNATLIQNNQLHTRRVDDLLNQIHTQMQLIGVLQRQVNALQILKSAPEIPNDSVVLQK